MSMRVEKAFYEPIGDNRLDICNVDDDKVKKAAESVACFIPEWYLEFDEDKQVYKPSKYVTNLAERVSKRFENIYKQKLEFKQKINFWNQLSLGTASGFLITKWKIATAFHVIGDKYGKYKSLDKLKEMRVVFGLAMKNKYQLRKIPKDNVYEIEEIVSSAYNSVDHGKDIAILRLNRKVKDRIPLNLNFIRKVQINDEVSLIGCPEGLPLKFASKGKVVENDYKGKRRVSQCELLQTFQMLAASFSGNSGSPIFDKDWNVVGILIEGQVDYEVKQIGILCFKSLKIQPHQITKEDIDRLGYEMGQSIYTAKSFIEYEIYMDQLREEDELRFNELGEQK